jgi:hypothetical protein
MKQLQKYKRPGLSDEVLYWIDHNLKNYLTKKPHKDNYSEIDHIIDYLSSDEAPKRLKKMSVKEARKNAEKWVAKMIRKSEGIVETEEDTEIVLNFENGFKLVKLVGKNAFEREGNLMSHCVSSYFGKSDCSVYSLRDLKNNPHCTIELTSKNGYVNQIKGKGNGSIHPKYINMVLKVLKYFEVDVNSNDLPNLGYVEVSDELKAVIDGNMKGAKWLTFGGDRFFYKYSKLSKV